MFIYRGQCTLINTYVLKIMICTRSPAKNRRQKIVGIKIREKMEVLQYFDLMNFGKTSLFASHLLTTTLRKT